MIFILTDLGFIVAILMIGIWSLSPESIVLMYLRFNLLTTLGCISCLCNVSIFVLFILYLQMLDIAPGFRARYVLFA